MAVRQQLHVEAAVEPSSGRQIQCAYGFPSKIGAGDELAVLRKIRNPITETVNSTSLYQPQNARPPADQRSLLHFG